MANTCAYAEAWRRAGLFGRTAEAEAAKEAAQAQRRNAKDCRAWLYFGQLSSRSRTDAANTEVGEST